MYKTGFRSKLKRFIIYFIIAFIVVFALRFCYEMYYSRHNIVQYNGGGVRYELAVQNGVSQDLYSVKNVASAKISQKDSYTGQSIAIDQKYEKVANLATSSSSFEDDNQKLRQTIQNYDAVIQMEKLFGLKGSQTLIMSIGIMPDRFDDLVESIKEIGNLRSFSVDKIDKTDEFRKLIAEKETLLKTRAAYEAIKERGGDIKDLLMLEDKILEVEARMQSLGVNLGSFSSENSFCTVNFSLTTEYTQASGSHISISAILDCAFESLVWTLILFVVVTTVGVFFVVALLIIILVAIKFQKLLPKETAAAPGQDAEPTETDTKV